MITLRRRAWICTILIAIGLLSALPNALSDQVAARLPSWYVNSAVTLGLDLRGGSHLLLQVNTTELVDADTLRFADRVAAVLDDADIGHRPAITQEGRHVLPLEERSAAPRAAELARELALQDGRRSFVVHIEGSDLVLVPTRAHLEVIVHDAVQRSVDIVRQRLDATGVVEPTVARQGRDAIIVQLLGVDDPARIRELLGTTAKLTFHLVESDRTSTVATVTLPDVERGTGLLVRARPALEGTHLTDARVGFDERTDAPLVRFELDRDGARRFADLTRQNIGRGLAIVLDDQIISAPVIQSIIPGGVGQITGSFTVADAANLALLLRAGALPAPLDVVEERTVGPDLGSDAVAAGLSTGLIGAGLVFACLFALYGRWGIIASCALLLNVVLIFGTLSLIGATLTLPGIAGIVLAIGMAVDANILINERIREETRLGRKPMAALDAGFKRAFGTIVDSSVTTLIATSLLFLFGSGPVKGFAVTIAIGLLMSMFTAVAVTRLLMEWRVRRLRRRPLAIGGIEIAPHLSSRTVRFMRGRYAGLILSAAVSAVSVGLLVHNGLNLGVDFAGGTAMEVRVDESVPIDSLRQALIGHGVSDAGVQEFGPAGSYWIRTPVSAEATSGDTIERIQSAVRSVAADAEFPQVDMVGPRVSQSFLETAVLAVLLAGLGMMAYLWMRFEWPFALAAIASLGLDLTKMLGFFALFGIEFNLAAIAALLTFIGYSVNDKVVIFDRIREHLRASSSEPLQDLFDRSLTATLARTVFTSVTTFLAIVPMAIAGGSAVASFAVPMLFGIVLGTSSSIFIAAPLVLLLAQRYFERSRLFGAFEEEPSEYDAVRRA
jgi:SecD/SecF fusion protein